MESVFQTKDLIGINAADKRFCLQHRNKGCFQQVAVADNHDVGLPAIERLLELLRQCRQLLTLSGYRNNFNRKGKHICFHFSPPGTSGKSRHKKLHLTTSPVQSCHHGIHIDVGAAFGWPAEKKVQKGYSAIQRRCTIRGCHDFSCIFFHYLYYVQWHRALQLFLIRVSDPLDTEDVKRHTKRK